MPNRVIRDWTDSERVDQVSFQAEALFIRLMMKADDYGSYHGNPRLINSFCFPLKNLRDTDISRWLHELVSAGLIAAYDADNKQYIHIVNFNQRLRQSKAKFPQIPENVLDDFIAKNSLTGCCQVADNFPPETETEVETEKEEKKNFSPPSIDEVKQYFKEKGYNEVTAIKAFNYYDVAKWKDGKGNQVKNWKQKMISVWFKDENKIVEQTISVGPTRRKL
ncbi:hypothetical protein FCL53_17090 [Elizabethkingia meningoseptica]|uniref:hypothetical protein n=1 Tax=Elizabethkingia meningoseptica TaxID=238 RepID=UPI0013665987|nr:hypothetical protein [Elizabethkingia meningoseptica]MVW93680.1 hypothetical protein [Elizabethkingia meningoseptica]